MLRVMRAISPMYQSAAAHWGAAGRFSSGARWGGATTLRPARPLSALAAPQAAVFEPSQGDRVNVFTAYTIYKVQYVGALEDSGRCDCSIRFFCSVGC